MNVYEQMSANDENAHRSKRQAALMEKLEELRINRQSINIFMNELSRMVAATKNDAAVDEVNVLPDEPVPYKLYREAWELMPMQFKKSCPVSYYMSMQDTPAEKVKMEKIREYLIILMECCEDRDKLCYSSGEHADFISMKDLMALLDQEYISHIVKDMPSRITCGDKVLIAKPVYDVYIKYIEERIRLMIHVSKDFVRINDLLRANICAKLRALTNSFNLSECTLSQGAINAFDVKNLMCDYEWFGHLCKGKDYMEPKDFADYATYNAGTRSYLFFPCFVAWLFEYLWETGELRDRNQMPFWNFAKFLLMYRGISMVPARRFFFNLLDLNGDGRISRMESDKFFSDIYEIQKSTKSTYAIPKLETEADFNSVWSSWIDVLGLSSSHTYVTFDDVKHNPNAEHFLLMLTNEDRFEQLEESKDGIKDKSMRMQMYTDDTQYPAITDEQLIQAIFE